MALFAERMTRILAAIGQSYKNVGMNLHAYYDAYGGTVAILLSPYLHLAILLSIITPGNWSTAGWWDIPLSILPNVLGFTLGGYAMLIAFGDERFKALLTASSTENPSSAFMAINATFMHFLLVQIGALLAAVVAKSRPLSYFDSLTNGKLPLGPDFSTRQLLVHVCWFIGYALFVYALTLAFAATAAVFRVARWFERSKQFGEQKENK